MRMIRSGWLGWVRGVWLLCLVDILVSQVHAQPVITAITSARQTVNLGGSITLSVTATGASGYQWKRNGELIRGATANSYTISEATSLKDSGWYQVEVVGLGNYASRLQSPTVFVEIQSPSPRGISTEPVAQWPGFARGAASRVQVVGDKAYVAVGLGGVAVFDVSNPSRPVRLQGYDVNGYAYGMQVVDNAVYVVDGAAGLKIFDQDTHRC